MGIRELMRRRSTLRGFAPWERPESMAGDRAEQGIQYLTSALGRWHPDTVQARQKLRWWLRKEGDPAAARRLAEEEVAGRAAEYGADHPDTLAARRELVQITAEAAGRPAAIAEARALSDDMRRVLGPTHKDTLLVRREVGYLLRDNGTWRRRSRCTPRCSPSWRRCNRPGSRTCARPGTPLRSPWSATATRNRPSSTSSGRSRPSG
ncbi:hypothetical protein AMIS_23330 [Actinoplanes missouriensis 431]|uniref:Tetratricopeptide repeat protein n=1 Tax=Actinoplanes missouriensis (strain ATCC 14538 / DSM 43046 / CBS 188.64 / JCM 3121 / NBRC 102363 / NCIMB 12654 / NRRL B-3342 / UNCC 431) TaxID=512565 RepID=I0H3G6_ACTM4|nr:hypothetical protein AMIS_23330 [Actinoplanes missouriensis 431]